MQIEQRVIANEEEAWALLRETLEGYNNENIQLSFDAWPKFEIILRGEDFYGSVPTRVMPPILELQRNIHRTYCRIKYNSDDLRNLKKEEKEQLEIVVKVQNGSSHFIVELFDKLNTIAETTSMTGPQMVTLLLGVGLMWTSYLGWKKWVESSERKHQQGVTVQLSEQETQRVTLLTQSTERVAELAETAIRMNDFRDVLAKQLKPADAIYSDNTPVITGARAEQIITSVKETSQEVRIDGDFRITEVKFPLEFGGPYRLNVSKIDEDLNFMVMAAHGMLDAEEIAILQESGFQVKKAYMEINAKKRGTIITKADLVNIRWPQNDAN